MEATSQNFRIKVLAAIKGAEAVIPDIWTIHPPAWSEAVNPHVEQMRSDINGWFESLFPHRPRKVAGLKGADFGYFAATWYPDAEYEELRMACYLSAWIFLWDDEFDEAIATNDIQAADEYRAVTLQYISDCLFPDDSPAMPRRQLHCDKLRILTSFQSVVAAPFRECYDRDRLQLLFNEIIFYIKGVETEQCLQRLDTVPTLQEYCAYRMGSSAVRFVLCVNEAVCKIRLPTELLADPEMSVLWDAATQHIWLVNDLFSGKKEVAQGNASLLPLLFDAGGNDLQFAVDVIVDAVQVSIQSFEASAMRLKSRFGYDENILLALEKYIACCRSNCTGNLGWSLRTGRYGMEQVEGVCDGSRLLRI